MKVLWSADKNGVYVDLQRFAYLYELTFAFEAFVIFFAAFRVLSSRDTFERSINLQKFCPSKLGNSFLHSLFSTTFFGFAVLAHNIYGSSIESTAQL